MGDAGVEVGKIIRQWILPFALALCAIALGWYLRMASTPDAGVALIRQFEVTEIRMTYPSHEIDLKYDNGRWIDLRHPQWIVDDLAVIAWIDALFNIQRDRVLSQDSSVEKRFSAPILRVTLASSQNKKWVINVGDNTVSSRVFVGVNDQIATVKAVALAPLWVAEDGFRLKRPFQSINSDSITAVSITGKFPGVTRNNWIFEKGPATGLWFYSAGQNGIADPIRVSRVLNLVQSMTIAKFIKEPAGPTVYLTLSGENSIRLKLKMTSNDTAAVQLSDSEWGIIYPILISSMTDLLRFPNAESPLHLNRFKWTKFEITTSKNETVLVKNELGHWLDQNGKVKTVPINNLASVFSNLVTTQSIQINGGDDVTIKISSGNQSEVFLISRINDSTFVLKLPKRRMLLFLHGDGGDVYNQFDKLTTPY